MSLVELENAVKALGDHEFGEFTRWIDELAAERWDRRIAADVAAGRLDRLAAQADAAFEAGRCREL